MPFVEEMLTGVLDQVRAHVTDLEVEPFPDNPEEYDLYHPVGAVLIAYGGSPRYSDSHDTGVNVQDREVQFSCTLLLRHLRGPQGAHTYLDTLRLALNGYRLPGGGGGSKLRPIQERVIDHDSGIWRFEMRFQGTVPEVEQDVEEALPILERITLESANTTTEVTDDE
jgi:hypothetical protein